MTEEIKITKEELNQYIELKRKNKKMIERSKYYTKRRNIKIGLMLKYCEENGITVDEKQVDEECKRLNIKKPE